MAFSRFSLAILAAAGLMWTITGCGGSPSTMPETRTSQVEVESSPVEPHRQVHVDVGHGRGVHVDVEKPSGERAVDVNVPPRSPEVDVNP